MLPPLGKNNRISLWDTDSSRNIVWESLMSDVRCSLHNDLVKRLWRSLWLSLNDSVWNNLWRDFWRNVWGTPEKEE